MGSSPDSRATTTPQRRLLPTEWSSPARGTGGSYVACPRLIRDDPRAHHFDAEETMEFTNRLAVPADVPELTALMDQAIGQLQRAFLDDAQIASSRAIMGIDTQLIEDGTYFVVQSNADIAGCG